jgi:putative membrane protein
MINWNEPQKQSAFGIFMFAGKALREVVTMLIVFTGFWVNDKKPFKAFLLLYGGAALYVFGKAFLEYFYFTFHISGQQLIIKKGIFSKKTLIIPFERIQTVHLQQNLLHKIIGHCKVSIDTAGTEKTEVAIQSLAYKKALQLKELLSQENVLQVAAGEEMDSGNRNIIRLAGKDLFKMALSANHLETFGLIIAFVLARFENVKDLLGINAIDYVEEHGKEVTFTAQTIGIIIFFTLAFSILISVVRIILKYSDFTIQLTDKGFHLKHGMLQSHQQFVGTRKIQYILWRANWIRRKIGIYMFHVKTAGEDEIKKKQRIHVPVTRTEHLQQLSAYYQLSFPSLENEENFIQKDYVYRRILLVGFPVTVVAIAIAWIWWDVNAFWIGLWLLYFTISAAVYRKNFRIWVNEDAIEISRGVWGRERLILNWSKLQLVTVQQSIYQRRKGLASLSLQTASGEVTLPYLRAEESGTLADFAVMKIESTPKNWM